MIPVVPPLAKISEISIFAHGVHGVTILYRYYYTLPFLSRHVSGTNMHNLNSSVDANVFLDRLYDRATSMCDITNYTTVGRSYYVPERVVEGLVSNKSWKYVAGQQREEKKFWAKRALEKQH